MSLLATRVPDFIERDPLIQDAIARSGACKRQIDEKILGIVTRHNIAYYMRHGRTVEQDEKSARVCGRAAGVAFLSLLGLGLYVYLTH